MNQRDYQEAFPKTPAHFVNRMNNVLSEIENEKPRRVKGRRPAALLVAAIVILALTGSAVAVGSAMGVFDFIKHSANPIEPLKGAEKLVESGLGRVEGEFGSIEVTEGVYSGRSCKATLKLDLVEGYDCGYPEMVFLNAETPDSGVIDTAELGTQSRQFMLEMILEAQTPETLACEIRVPVSLNGSPAETQTIGFSLRHAQAETATLVPLGEGERWRIVSGSVTRNEFSLTFDVEYLYTPEPDEDMGVDIKAFDENGTRYAENDGSSDVYERADGTIVHRQIQEIQSSEKMPESIVFKPKVIGADKWLDAIECKVE